MFKKLNKILLGLPIKAKLVTVFTFLIAVIALFIYKYFPAKLEEQELNFTKKKTESIANMTAFSISPALYFNDVNNISELLEGTKRTGDIIYIQVFNNEKDIYIYDIIKSERKSENKGECIYSHLLHINRKISSNFEFHDDSCYFIGRNVKLGSKVIGRLEIGFSLAPLNKEIVQSKQSIALVSIGIFIFGVLLVISLSSIIIKPLKQFEEAIEKVNAGDLSGRVPVTREDEIGVLANAFNSMLSRLGAAYKDLAILNNDLEERVTLRQKQLEKESEQRIIAEKIRIETESLSEGLMGLSPVGIIIIDNDKNIISNNPAARELFNMSVWEPYQEIKSFNDLFKNSSVIAKNLLDGRTLKGIEIELPGENHTIKTIVINAAPRYNAEGSILGGIILCTDITEFKDLRKQLMQSQKLEAIGTLAGGIAHDFNNMLTGIIINTELAEMGYQKGLDIGSNLSRVKSASTQAAELTSRLLSFSRKKVEKPQPININTCVDESIYLLNRIINPLIEIKTNKEKQVHQVEADSAQITQVLVNIMLNAGDAMPDGGKLEISTKTVYIDKDYSLIYNEPPGSYERISIKDTGTGMPQEVMEHIFEPFFTTKEVGKGTGLGLAMSYGIIKSHNGWIEVESEIDKGTTFCIYLPSLTKAGDSLKYDIEKEIETGGGNILIVDDSPSIRAIGKELLEHYGYNVILANDGQDAIHIYDEKKADIDLVILDLLMPRKPGKEVLYELQRIDPKVKIIISSGYYKNSTHEEFIALGARAFLQKPYTSKEILSVVEKVKKSN